MMNTSGQRSLPVIVALCLVALLLGLSFKQAKAETSGQMNGGTLRDQLEQIRRQGKTSGLDEPVRQRNILVDIYARDSFSPLWTRPGQVSQMLAAIGDSKREGLRPEDYHHQAVLVLNRLLMRNPNAASAAELDILLTDALLSLGHDKLFGKVDPMSIENTWNMNSRRQEAVVRPLLTALKEDRLPRVLAGLSPSLPFYTDLAEALVRYMTIADRSGGWPSVLNGPPLRQGMQGPRVESLRRRLLATGELQRLGDNPAVFDEELTKAVKAFQLRHYLEADGVVGKAALSALNVPVTERINQIRINLERSRWVLQNVPDTFIIVDIAGFSLQYRHQGRLAWTGRVVVGKPYHQTPVFRSEIRQMVLNPTWTVPVNIASREILPQVMKSPSYLAEQRLRVLDTDGREIAPAQINFRQYAGKNFPYTFRQDAGPDAALGRIKFSFENPYSVYLHDTPSKALFDKSSRAFSHGCIRVQDPLDLARLLLRNDAGNTTGYASFDRILQGGKTESITLKIPVPVILLYWTAQVKDEKVCFKPDLYGRDQLVLKALDAPPDSSRQLRRAL